MICVAPSRLANAPNAGSELELHVRHIRGGAFSEALFGSLREGAVLRIEGPLGQLRYESAKLKRLVADLSLDRHILQEIVAKKL